MIFLGKLLPRRTATHIKALKIGQNADQVHGQVERLATQFPSIPSKNGINSKSPHGSRGFQRPLSLGAALPLPPPPGVFGLPEVIS